MLEVRKLSVAFGGGNDRVLAVDEVSFAVASREALGIVGESGSGKSTLAAAVMGLLPAGGRIEQGEIRFEGRDLRRLAAGEMRRLRGRKLAMIPQDASAALNPVFTVGTQIKESLEVAGVPAVQRTRRALQLLAEVRIPAPDRRLRAYPHMLSGGIKQRVLGAMALAGEPALLIADEPTTALDVTVQAEYLQLLRELQQRHGFGLLLISHDLGVVAGTCGRVAVMYAGRIVEQGPTADLFTAPRHPYTAALLGARPMLAARYERLEAIPGEPPNAARWPSGCRFAPRCPVAKDTCRVEPPPLTALGTGRSVACFAPLPEGAGRRA